MARSCRYWLGAAWRRTPPETTTLVREAEDMALDASAAEDLAATMAKLGAYWIKRFEEMAARVAARFADGAARHSSTSLARTFRRYGWTVSFRPTPAERDVLRATVAENVSLIKSIPQEHLKSVEGSVMRAVQAGQDLGALYEDLRHRHGVTKRRAELIAIDQNSKVTGALQKVRYLELDIQTATWMHSGAGREPRPHHVAMNGKSYEVAKGMWDPVERKFIYPGQLIRCRCSSRPNVPGFS